MSSKASDALNSDTAAAFDPSTWPTRCWRSTTALSFAATATSTSLSLALSSSFTFAASSSASFLSLVSSKDRLPNIFQFRLVRHGLGSKSGKIFLHRSAPPAHHHCLSQTLQAHANQKPKTQGKTMKDNKGKRSYPHQRMNHKIRKVFRMSNSILVRVSAIYDTLRFVHRDMRTLIYCSHRRIGQGSKISVHHDDGRDLLDGRNNSWDGRTRRRLLNPFRGSLVNLPTLQADRSGRHLP
jgi:hypothetical protein